MTDSNDQEFWNHVQWWSPEHAQEVEDAVEALLRAINSMVISGAPEVMEHRTIEWCVERLRDSIRGDIESELKLRLIKDDNDD